MLPLQCARTTLSKSWDTQRTVTHEDSLRIAPPTNIRAMSTMPSPEHQRIALPRPSFNSARSRDLPPAFSRMAGQVFALIVGIDKYQAGNIWNLDAAVDDARSIERWLTSDLQVPRDHICTLLDAQATKRNIEERFVSHLLNNSAIEPGDAIIVYFAGHGSSIRAPPGWFDRGRGDVSVLCTYDYDTKLPKGQTNAGISDRSLHAMLQDLARAKGDNITLILDTCFSLPTTSNDDPKERRFTRFTPTRKATSEDLLAGLWSTATPHKAEPVASRGFTGVSSDSHVVLAACSSGWAATERKDGGNFTRALLALKDARPLHKFTYADLPAELAPYMGDHQYAACAGMNVDRLLFDGVPFVPDTRYISVSTHDHEHVQVDAGEMQGITVGTEFAIYPHNRRGSLNSSTGIYVATLVFATWCLAKPKSSGKQMVREGWARVTRWNNQTPFRVDVKYSLFSFFRRNRLAAKIPSNAVDLAEKNGVGVLRAKSAKSADLSVKVKSKELLVERRDALIPANCQSILHIPSAETRTDLKAIEAAARFNMHLYRKQPSRPFAGKGARRSWTRRPRTRSMRSSSTTTRMSTSGRTSRTWTRVVTAYPWSTTQILLPPAPHSVDTPTW
ncbi:hypothetical protein K466DRAFT_519659 [Polyporus arcularius HHB13444]|uniref:Peptidase C14 caspase domain-containing protein n=1 Tax=Polyporus arcularius HHB13444 TaxID=1314778 RepID=A0A5C3PHR9_9APHY|nr:hypothetical protein K466DRAFT_519659 [Polyporus arcularius HHB13444]